MVEQNSAQIAVLDLNKDCVYNVYNDNGDICNTVQIKNGKVKMIYADCKDKICKNHKEISKSNESIICLPNKVEVTVISDKSEDICIFIFGVTCTFQFWNSWNKARPCKFSCNCCPLYNEF